MDPIDLRPPADDEFEVSLFGPGLGECLVLHLGHGHWLVVDSCTVGKSREPVASQYLRSLGLSPSECVREIVISHWHSDHIGGASALVEECEGAVVYYPAALKTDEFVTLTESVAAGDRLVDRFNNGVREMAEVLRTLAARGRKQRHYVSHHFRPVVVNRELVALHHNGQNVTVRALSPSDVAFNLALLELKKLIPAPGTPPRVLPRPQRNHSAVALWVEFGDRSVLLGSDLEEQGGPYTGWSVVVGEHGQRGRAEVFKVPHHGSVTGHCDAVWTGLLANNPFTFTTTHSQARLPRDADVRRIKGYTDTFACTTVPLSTLPKRDPSVERTLREVTMERRPVRGEMGHIQLRMKVGQPIKVRGNKQAVLF